jgi:predicted nucleotidyltransferase
MEANVEGYEEAREGELGRIVELLKRSGALRVILFGSYARGRRDALVDLDLIVVQESRLPFVERTAELYRQVVPKVAVDFLVYTPAEWQEMKDSPFIRHALAEGKVLYEKDAP